jgi:hypothetical protein
VENESLWSEIEREHGREERMEGEFWILID